jgi:hypothetical protein
MKRKIVVTFFGGMLLLIFSGLYSCQSIQARKETIETEESLDATDSTPMAVLTEKPASLLDGAEYLQWLKEHQGITYDEAENETVSLNILYRALPLESAISIESDKNAEAAYQKMRSIKKGFHYLVIECLDKQTSASTVSNSKRELPELIKKNLVVIKNETDTVRFPIIEIFPSQVMNQPGKLIVMVPADSTAKDFQAMIPGKDFGLKTLKIQIKANQFELFPEIKL